MGTGSVFPPWGSPAQGTGSSSHMGHTDCYVQGVRGAGSRSPYLIPGPLLSGDLAHGGRRAGGQPPQGRVLASGVGHTMGGTSPVLSSRE